MQDRLRKIIIASFYCVVIAAIVVATVHAATWKRGSGAIYGGVIESHEQRLNLGSFSDFLREAELNKLNENAAAVSNNFPTNLSDRNGWQNYLGFLGLIIGVMAIIGTLILLCGCWCLVARKPIYNRLLSSKTAATILLLAQFLTIGLFAVIAIGVSGGYSADFREMVRDTEILSAQALNTITTAGTFVNEARNQSLQFLAGVDRNISLSAVSTPLDGLFGVIQTTIANSNDVLGELDKLGRQTTLLKLMLSSSTMSVQDFREKINKGKALIDQVDGTADALQESAQEAITSISDQVDGFIATAETQVNYYADRVMSIIGTINVEASNILGDQQFQRYTRTVLQVENTRVGVTTAILGLAIVVSLIGLVLALLNFKKILLIYAWLLGIVAVLVFAIVGLHISFYVGYTDACKKNEVIIVNAANQLVTTYVPQAVLSYANIPVPTIIHNVLNCKGDQTFLTAAGFNESYVSGLLNVNGYIQSMQGYLDNINDASLFSQIRTGIDSSEEYVNQVDEIQDEYSTFISVLGFNAKIRSIKAAPTQARRFVTQMESGVKQIKQNATQMLNKAEVLVDTLVGKGVDIASCSYIGNYYADLQNRVCSSYRAMMIVILLFSLFVGLCLFSESWLLLVRSYQPPVKKEQPYPQAQYLYPATLSPTKPLPITGA